MKMTPDQLKQDLRAIIDPGVADLVVDGYLDMQQRHYAGDWGPSELDGGKFCEAIARALYEIDTGSTSTLSVGAICDQLRKSNPPPVHRLGDKDRAHFCRILTSIYNFRNDRGVAHISLVHEANLMDATLIVAVVKWLFGEFLRLAQNLNRDEVAAIISAIIQLEHPLIHDLNGQPLVLLIPTQRSESCGRCGP